MKPIAPNTMIQNRYLVVQPIGKGGMGEVYLAVDQRLGSAVALKRTYFHDDGALGGAFEREARILARLRHPVLPKVIDHFIENDDQFLVMEHISGDDIAKRLETTQKPFPLNWVMFWADQLLDALTYLHNHEPPIIHRDIKPQNLKLTDENHIVLLDFGLSKDFETGGNSLNSASVAGYSPHFAAMEQIRGMGTDARSDLYSLSATLYQLMTNEIPVDALSRADALLGGKPDPVLPLNSIVPSIPAAVSDVILKGISIRQEGRFDSAAEMQKALRRAYNNGETAAEDTNKALPGEKTTQVMPAPSTKANPSLDATLQMNEADLPKPVGDSEIETSVRKKGTRPLPDRAAPATSSPSSAEPSRPKAATRTKSRSSSAGVYTGVLAGVLILGGIAAAGGWYAYNNYGAGNTERPPATNSAAVSSNSNTGVSGDLGASNIAPVNSENTNVVGEQPGRTTPADRQTATNPISKPSSGKPQVPAAKATPKPKSGDDRTVIIQ